MMKRLLLFICILVSHHLLAQEEVSFSLLRQDDVYNSYEDDSLRGAYQAVKFVPLGRKNHLSFGGSYRGQFEYFDNEEFSFSPNRENGWYLQRLLAHANLQVGNRFRVFGELGSSLIEGKEDLSPVDQDELYVNQLIAQYETENFRLTAGRENLKLGSRRLVDPREGPNVRQAFDHLTIDFMKGNRSYKAFIGSPMVPQQGVFDNEDFENEEWLWGFYVTKLLSGKVNFDAYYLGSHYETSVYALGAEEELRHSLGVRAWKNIGNWQFDNEAVYQFGSFGDAAILAYTISFNVHNQLNKNNRLGVKTELISGTTTSGTLGTFNPLYPRGAYFGRVARFGPANLIDIHPYWTFTLGKFIMEIDYDVFWRYSNNDAVYGPPMNIVLEGESDERLIAQQVGTIFNYEFSPHAMIELETNFIFPAAYIDEVRPGAERLLHVVFTTEFRF